MPTSTFIKSIRIVFRSIILVKIGTHLHYTVLYENELLKIYHDILKFEKKPNILVKLHYT